MVATLALTGKPSQGVIHRFEAGSRFAAPVVSVRSAQTLRIQQKHQSRNVN